MCISNTQTFILTKFKKREKLIKKAMWNQEKLVISGKILFYRKLPKNRLLSCSMFLGDPIKDRPSFVYNLGLLPSPFPITPHIRVTFDRSDLYCQTESILYLLGRSTKYFCNNDYLNPDYNNYNKWVARTCGLNGQWKEGVNLTCKRICPKIGR